jgi:hypothetical protein
MQKIEKNQPNRRNQMKFNKWTLGLAAIGAVSLTSAARADDVTNSLMTAVASTTISGYVDTSINWTPGTGNAFVPAYAYNQSTKADGFNLNSIRVTIAKAEDETEWASGYQVDLFGGPDSGLLGTTGGGFGLNIGQAFVTLRTPIGTGIDWKLGMWDTIIGYESTEVVNDPNFTRSYGYTIEPTTHTGLNGTYKITDSLSTTLGIANTAQPAFVNNRASAPGGSMAESYKTYMGALSFTAPTNWGAESGSSIYVGFINGFDGNNVPGSVSQNLYLGTTINTPMTELKVGASYDYFMLKAAEVTPAFGVPAVTAREQWADAIDFYATYQATDKLSFNTRVEYFWQSLGNTATGSGAGPVGTPAAGGNADKIFAVTETIEYDLWKNVMSRLELRWDHQAGSPTGPQVPGNYTGVFGGYAQGGAGAPPNGVSGSKFNNYQVIANIIYKF